MQKDSIFVSDASCLEDLDWCLGLKVELMALMRREVDLILLNTAKPLIKHAPTCKRFHCFLAMCWNENYAKWKNRWQK